MLAMVSHNLGVCILPELVVRDISKNVVRLPLNPPMERVLGGVAGADMVDGLAGAFEHLDRTARRQRVVLGQQRAHAFRLLAPSAPVVPGAPKPSEPTFPKWPAA